MVCARVMWIGRSRSASHATPFLLSLRNAIGLARDSFLAALPSIFFFLLFSSFSAVKISSFPSLVSRKTPTSVSAMRFLHLLDLSYRACLFFLFSLSLSVCESFSISLFSVVTEWKWRKIVDVWMGLLSYVKKLIPFMDNPNTEKF